MGNSKFEALLTRLMSLVSQPEVLFLILVAVPVVLISSKSTTYRWWLLAAWAFVLPITPLNDWLGNWIVPPFPFDRLVLYGRQIALFMLIGMLPAAMRFRGQNPDVKVPPALLGLLLMNVIYCGRYLPTALFSIAMVRLGAYLAIFYLLALSLPKWITDQRELYRYLQAAGYSILAFVLASLACYILSPGSMVPAGRMSGLTSGPNYMGAICGFSMPVLLGLSLSPSLKIRDRYFWLFVAALVFIFVLWTGSRTSLGMCALGVAVIFRAKLGRILVVGVPLVLLVWGLSFVFTDAQTGAQRMADSTNTRTEVWMRFIDLWMQNPIFGNAEIGMRTIENSYLALAANTGVAGCLAIIVFLILTAKTCLKLLRLRPTNRDEKILRDIALAGIIVLLGNSVLEATLLSGLSGNAFWVFLYFVLADVILRLVAVERSKVAYQQAVQLQYQATGR